jgi:hypothetical protein
LYITLLIPANEIAQRRRYVSVLAEVGEDTVPIARAIPSRLNADGPLRGVLVRMGP